jgi:hypothetical protein
MKMKTTMIVTTLMLLAFTASAEEVAPEPYVLTMTPQFLELWKDFDTLDECKAEGVELVTSSQIFNGFACEQGRAWIAADEVAVPAVWMPEE